MMNALRDGIRRVNGAPAILAGAWLLTMAAGLPLALVMRGMIAEHLGRSLTADAVAAGVDSDWMQEFAEHASGVGVTLRPTIIGFGAVLDNLSAFIDDAPRPLVVSGIASVYIGLWLFVAGGVIDRYARDRATRASGFFAACGTFFFRFLRLGIIMLAVYGFLFGFVHRWLFGALWERLTHDLTVERTAFLIRVVLYLVFGVMLAACNLVFDYTKVRAVVEDRRSMLGALSAALRFVSDHFGAAAALYLTDFGLFAAAVLAYGLLAPGAGRGMGVWLVFALGQIYVLARLWVKLVFWASEIALFQSRMAHAGYVAAPLPTWPDSPVAEAVARKSVQVFDRSS
jgi:hypothetical protein